MSIATRNQFWGARLNGEDPTNPDTPETFSNTAWTLEAGGDAADGSASNGWWVINADSGGQMWKSGLAAATSYTLFSLFKITTAPDSAGVIMAIDNGTHRVEVRSKGNTSKLDLVGATTATTHDLDLNMTEDQAVPIALRLTMDSSGNAKLYMREIINDDAGVQHYLSVVGSSSSSQGVFFGNTSGVIEWASVYATNDGAFNPDELATSSWVQDTLIRMGLAIVEKLQASTRAYLKTHVPNSSIIYGYDISSKMLSRLHPPTIHVIVDKIDSPEFNVLGGGKIDQEYQCTVYISTKGTDYENAYRTGLNIAGEVFDELYTGTGLNANIDSLTNYSAALDTKMDDDEMLCIHILRFNYMRRINMRRR